MPSAISAKGSLTPLVGAFSFIVISAVYVGLHCLRRRENHGGGAARRNSISASLSALFKLTGNDGGRIRPPFPPVIRDMLSRSRLAYLSTVDSSASSSHLSLMRFTYLRDESDGELIVMSTNRRTKKFDMLRDQKGVALLVHDFGSGEDSGGGAFSITLNGVCIIEEGERAEKFRAAHLEHNPDYPQFIVGEDIAILSVEVKEARTCNINDQVQKWTVAGGS